MLVESKILIEAFQDVMKKSEETCGKELEEIRELINIGRFFRSIVEKNNQSSLVFWCFMESIRISGQTLYLSYCGLYRNAFDNIRHLLESIVQAVYIDKNHPSSDLPTKLEILKEIEDKKEYHARRLIEDRIPFKNLDCKGLDCKGLLNKEYSELSQIVHPSHEKIIVTVKDVLSENKWIPARIDCGEISRILDSMRRMYDIFLFLVVVNFPECKTSLRKDSKLVATIKKHNLRLLERAIT
jgi:hypothetical protein